MKATENNNTDVVVFLHSNGFFNANDRDCVSWSQNELPLILFCKQTERTPFHNTAYAANIEIAKLLIESGADVNTHDIV